MSDTDDLKALLQACEATIPDDGGDGSDPVDGHLTPLVDEHAHISVIPAHSRLPEHKRKNVPDPYASVRRLEHPLLVHEPGNVRAPIQTVEQACPHALNAIRAMAQADLKRLEWGMRGNAQPVLLVGPPGSGKSTVARLY